MVSVSKDIKVGFVFREGGGGGGGFLGAGAGAVGVAKDIASEYNCSSEEEGEDKGELAYESNGSPALSLILFNKESVA